jgi:hypothetical protein
MPTGSQPLWQLLRVEAGSVAPAEFAIEHKPAAESFPVENNRPWSIDNQPLKTQVNARLFRI